ncbi:MAG: acylphosphatase [Eubacteriales bacterium]|nr:acylphosphatase [Eubacteriales bacterium]
MEDREIVRRHYWFSGRVQGVGFRYRAFYIAQGLGLSGWVRNSWDERVEMEVQGTREAISQMLIRLQEQRFIDIERIEEEVIPVEADGWFSIK